MGFKLEQVQDFTPTPMTVATVIYYAGVHPYTLKPYKTVKTKEEKKDQNRYFFWYKRENHKWIKGRLNKINNKELTQRLLGDSEQKPDKKPKWLEAQRKRRR